ncbi:DNA-binding transcriptional LysR family regulator [Streptomyces africanus]|uniref:DNA-binding transcriptional LysR family regulator n=1 Tax=Streptomyces africanus TaxID=231024 RepID=A0ABU0QZL1_9ACTN|nr:LysR substrate-binding domain-containing protein [Streptomyces africanus]MDQ0752821.1 DNA-binding transcriptional LysR family regulator [Streptomyces africanus]
MNGQTVFEGEGITAGDLRSLRYFLAVADELSFGRAAVRLHMTQPGLSQGIKALERRLGMPLFERDRQSVALTAAGRVLEPKARQLLAHAEEFDRFASVLAGRHNGRLTLSFSRSGGIGLPTELTRRFREQYPHMTVETATGHTHANVERIRMRTIDVGFVRPPIDGDDLQCSVIAYDRVLVAVPVGHPLADRPGVAPADLVGEPLVFFPRERSGLWESMLGAVYGQGAAPEISRLEPDEAHMLAAVAQGAGITLVTEPSAALLAVPGVVFKPFTVPVAVPMALAWRKDNAHAALLTFVSFVHGAVGPAVPPSPAADAVVAGQGRHGQPADGATVSRIPRTRAMRELRPSAARR